MRALLIRRSSNLKVIAIDKPASLFISHGAPTLALADCPARHFLNGLGTQLDRPRAILVVTAHWETDEICLSSAARPATIHDFFGFDRALHEMCYAAPGAADLAHELCQRLESAGIAAQCDATRGFDHGTWIPLTCMYPEANIPVVQMSVCPAQSPLFHWRVGRALARLRHDDVLVIGSGSITHNLADFRARRNTPVADQTPSYVDEFCSWIAARVAAGDSDALLAYRELAPHGVRAHPSAEHFLPLHVALGAAGVSWSGERLHQSRMYGVVAMDSYLFRSRLPAVH